MSKFSQYEKIPGGDADQVEVLVRQNVLEKYGEPEVDHASLTEMYDQALDLSGKDMTVKLYEGKFVGDEDSLKRFALGGHLPGSNTIHSAVGRNGVHFYMDYSCRAKDWDSMTTSVMPKLIRNSVELSEARNNRFSAWGDRAKYAGMNVVGGALMVAGVDVGGPQRYGERNEERELQILDKHSRDIQFPNRR